MEYKVYKNLDDIARPKAALWAPALRAGANNIQDSLYKIWCVYMRTAYTSNNSYVISVVIPNNTPPHKVSITIVIHLHFLSAP